MRLAFVSTMSGVPWGGSEELWAATAEEALGRHIDVVAFLHRWPSVPPRVARLQTQGLRLVYRELGLPDLRTRVRAKLAGTSAYLASQLRQASPDLICVSQGSTYDLVECTENADTARLLQSGSVPYAIVCHHNLDAPVPEGWREAATTLFRHASLTVFISDHNRRATERQLAIWLHNARVFQNPVNLKTHARVCWPSPGITRLACVARLDAAYKGQDVLFEALSTPLWQGREWVLSMYGQGADCIYLQELAASYGLRDRITFRGHVDDVTQIWAEAELLVLPSRSEGTPLSLVEAFVCGRPAVVTDVGDCARWAEEGETGFVAEAATAASVGRALDRAWLTRPRWQEMGDRAHRKALAMLDRQPGATLLDALLSLPNPGGHR